MHNTRRASAKCQSRTRLLDNVANGHLFLAFTLFRGMSLRKYLRTRNVERWLAEQALLLHMQCVRMCVCVCANGYMPKKCYGYSGWKWAFYYGCRGWATLPLQT